MMAVGDQHVVGASTCWIAAIRSESVTRSTMCSTPSSVTVPTGSPGSASSAVSPEARDSPQTGDRFALRGPGQVEPVGGRLGGGALVRQHAASPLVGDLETPEHPGDVAGGAAVVGEPHPVDGERRLVVGHQDPVAGATPGAARPPARTGPVAPAGHVDPGDVVLRPGLQRVDLGIGQHVVGRRDQRGQVVGGVTQGSGRAGTQARDLRVPCAMPVQRYGPATRQ